MDFIATGEINQSYPDAIGRRRIISVIALYHPTTVSQSFLAEAKRVIEEAGVGFKFE